METEESSSKDILKSTGLLGGSKAITIIIGIARTKVVAVLLGPFGVGLVDLFKSVIDVVKSITKLGIDFSSVRDIAESAKDGDKSSIGRTVATVYHWLWITGILGVVFTIVFSGQLSTFTFGDDTKAFQISLLAIAVLFYTLSGGQLAIIQGHRKIASLARANVYSSVLGFVITVPLYYFYGIDAIVPVIVLISLSTMLLSWWFVQKINIKTVKQSFRESFTNGYGMVKLGLFTVVTSFMSTATLYGIRAIISNKATIDAVGFYTAASALSVTYITLLLNVMSKDYFPRLSEVQENDAQVNKLVNEQTNIAVLLGAPLIIAMYVFLKPLIIILYSSKFLEAMPLLQWMLLGAFIRIIAWPIGYVFLAKAMGKIFVFTQTIWNGLYILFVIVGWQYLQLKSVGISFAIALFITYFVNLIIIKRVTDFEYKARDKRLIVYFAFLLLISFGASYLLDGLWSYVILGICLLLSSIISYKKLTSIISFNKIWNRFFGK